MASARRLRQRARHAGQGRQGSVGEGLCEEVEENEDVVGSGPISNAIQMRPT